MDVFLILRFVLRISLIYSPTQILLKDESLVNECYDFTKKHRDVETHRTQFSTGNGNERKPVNLQCAVRRNLWIVGDARREPTRCYCEE